MPDFLAGECMYYRRLIVFSTVVVLVVLFGASVVLLRQRWLADACEASATSISLSLQGYRDSHGGRLPPSFIEDKDTGERHSWRAMLLPFRISNPSIWEQYSFQESWNSSGNRQFGNRSDFACTAHSKSPEMTNYVAVVGKNTLWPPPEEPQMWPASVGMRVEPKWPNTIVIVELVESHIPWTEPRDITLDEFINTIKANPKGPFYNKCVHGIRAIDASGQLRVIDPYGDVDTIKRMFVVTGEATTSPPSTEPQEESDASVPMTEQTENNPDAVRPKP